MSNAPIYHIDPKQFWDDPYPDLAKMRADMPIAYVPELDATLLTRRTDVFEEEKNIDVFSSDQPDGLMQRLMGQNMMRKDGKDHQMERKVIQPAVSPRTVQNVWKQQFIEATQNVIDDMRPKGRADMVRDVAMRISGEALKSITGLTNMAWQEMDRVSQGMIDGCANYGGDEEVNKRCDNCIASINDHIDAMIPVVTETPNQSLLSVQLQAGLDDAQIRNNIKLAISGGQNEPRDVIAGLAWAMLTHPDQLAKVQNGDSTWQKAFEEYARWISPIGMSPRRIAKSYIRNGIEFAPEDRVFLMFGSANRDADIFDNPDAFDIDRDTRASIAFGAGPHFCAGAWASRCLIGEVAMPMLFDNLPGLRLDGETVFGGWAFRGPLSMPVAWDC